ncbi:MAG: hypothetical protein Q8Q92_01040 [bacterium]|nr:hypothetical protein [bacterium]
MAVTEMDSEIENFTTRNKIVYLTGNPPWEGPTSYIDTYGLKPLLDKLNKRRKIK